MRHNTLHKPNNKLMRCWNCGDNIYFDWSIRSPKGMKLPLEPYMLTNGEHVVHDCLESEYIAGAKSI
jgi:hypothetical protein